MHEYIAYLAVFILFMGLVLLQFSKPKTKKTYTFHYRYRKNGAVWNGSYIFEAWDLHAAKDRAYEILNGVVAEPGDHKLFCDDVLVAVVPTVF